MADKPPDLQACANVAHAIAAHRRRWPPTDDVAMAEHEAACLERLGKMADAIAPVEAEVLAWLKARGVKPVERAT